MVQRADRQAFCQQAGDRLLQQPQGRIQLLQPRNKNGKLQALRLAYLPNYPIFASPKVTFRYWRAFHFKKRKNTNMADTGDVSIGTVLRFNGELCRVEEYQHRTPGNLR